MREHVHHSGDAREAVIQGVARERPGGLRGGPDHGVGVRRVHVRGRPIIKSIAFALTIGVLIDAFVVRMTIVPAAMILLGRRAWQLPHWANRLIPNVDIEGASLPAPSDGRHDRGVIPSPSEA